MATPGDLLSAMQLVTADSLSRRIFDLVASTGGKASGWSVMKSAGAKPEEVQAALDRLRSLNVLDASGPGLDGFYYLTPLGFRLRSSMST
jgi:hypothetical protein